MAASKTSLMKIRISKNLYVNSSTLFRFEWRKYYPALVIHEKFEKKLKWTLRLIAFIGIASSVIAIDQWYMSLGFSVFIFLIEQFFERTAIEYTTMVIQPPPDFKIEYGQWKTNGFMLPKKKNGKDLSHFGPSYSDEQYAIKFFKYLRSWIDDNSNDDINNNLVVSFVIEPDNRYTTYFYANLGRKRLDYMFDILKEKTKYEKYGKRQQQFTTQMFYWNTLDYKDGYYIKQFLEFHKPIEPYFFTPTVIQPFDLPPKFLFDYSIKKYHLKIKNRDELKKSEPEFQYKPEKIEQKKTNNKKQKKNSLKEIEKVLSNTEDIGFMPNVESSVGGIILCYSDPRLAMEAYKRLIKKKKDKKIKVTIVEHVELIDLKFNIGSKKKLILRNQNYSKSEYNEFKSMKGGGLVGTLLIGIPPTNKRQIFLEKGMSPITVQWKFK